MYVYELHQLFEWNERAARWNEMLIIVKQDMITPASNCLKEISCHRKSKFIFVVVLNASPILPNSNQFSFTRAL